MVNTWTLESFCSKWGMYMYMSKNKFLVPGNISSLISILVRKTAHIQINMKTEFIPG